MLVRKSNYHVPLVGMKLVLCKVKCHSIVQIRGLQHMKLPLKSTKPISPDATEHNMKGIALFQHTCSVTSSADNICFFTGSE